MASTKKLNHKVELKVVNEKKRRKSDLVIMWQSLWGIVMQIGLHVRHIFQDVLESIKVWLCHDEFIEIRTFLKKYLPYVPDDLTQSWRDGKLLCILLNKLHPGCIPDAEHLNTNYALRNMYQAFDVLENTFGISPNASAEELVVCVEGSNEKLLEILCRLRENFESNLKIPKIVEPNKTQTEELQSNSSSKNCIAKGTGLMLAFVGRAANFVIFCSSVTNLNLVLEIKGPLNTICRERITKRSPKKKQSTTQLPQNHPPCFSRSKSYTEKSASKEDKDEMSQLEKNLIPMEYDIYMNQISVTYTPLLEGQHVISILWHGEHVSDSPYIVQVESNVEINGMYKSKALKSIPTSHAEDESNEKSSGKIMTPLDKIERIGKVIKRRVLRHIVKIKGKDIVVDSSDINHLAVALLKMDYNCQTDPSKTRRNSWGFTGDAERKLSVIRQFCVPPDEMEAQQVKLQRRSRSLTINDNIIQPIRKTTSFETEDIQQPSVLKSFYGGMGKRDRNNFHSFNEEEEDAFADIDKAFQIEEQTLNITQSERSSQNSLTCNSEVSEDKQSDDTNVSSLKENDESLQSLLSTDLKVLVSNDLNADSQENLSPHSSILSEECLVRQTNERKSLSSENSELIEDNCDNISKKLNLNFESMQQHDEDTVKSESFDEFCKDLSDMHAQESSVMSNDHENLTIHNTVRNSENTIPHSQCFIEKYPNLMKYLDELCKHTASEITRNDCESFITNTRSYYPRKTNKNKIRYPNKFRYTCKHNCWNNHREHERKGLYKCYRKNSKNRLALCKKQVCRRYSDTSGKGIMLNRSLKLEPNCFHERKDAVKCAECNVCNIIPNSNTRFTYSNEKEFIDKTTYPIYANITNNTKCNLVNSNFTSANKQQCEEKNNLLCLSNELNTNTTSSKESSPNIFSGESVNSEDNPPKEKISQDLFQLTSSQSDTKCNNFHIQEHNLVSLGQFNFKQFNLLSERSKGNLIKNKIKKLENAIQKDSQRANFKSRSERSGSMELVDVKARLKFWENACQPQRRTVSDSSEMEHSMNQSCESEPKNSNLYDENIGPTDLTTEIKSEVFSLPDDYSVERHTDEISLVHADVVELYYDSPQDDINENAVKSTNQNTEGKQEPKSQRSFSDPVLLDTSFSEGDFCTSRNQLTKRNITNNMSSTGNISSSLDADYWETSFDDDDSGADVIVSTEDEYIDDEIPDSTYWGDISHMKHSKMASISSYEEYCQYIDSEILKNQIHCAENCPSECKVFGIANYFGYVAVKNRFHVLTKGAGHGNLSVSVQGFGKHDVSFVSVRYKQKDIYEVTYQVMRPGLYLISLRWMENPIVGSPFLCKITF